MPLLPIRVLGPLSECTRSLTVIGQITGSTVKVSTVAGRMLAQFVAMWAEQSVTIEGRLSTTDQVIATQEFEGEISRRSATPEPVQPALTDLTSYPLRLSAPIYACTGVIGIDGSVPGAEIRVRSTGTFEVLVETTAPGGYVNAHLSRALNSGEILAVDQIACGTTGLTAASPPAATLPLDERQRLPVPRIVPPLNGCDRVVGVVGIVPGALVEIERSSGLIASAWIPAFTANLLLNPALTEGEMLRVRQRFPSCGFESDWSSPAIPVGPAQPVPRPVVERPLCLVPTRIRVRNLRPGARVAIGVVDRAGSTFIPLGRAETPSSVFDFELVPGSVPADHLVVALQAVCDGRLWSENSNRVALGAPPVSLTPPLIGTPIHECAGVVRVDRLIRGSMVFIEDASTRARLSDVTLVSASQADIRVRPLLRAGQNIRAIAIVCAEQAMSETVTTSDVGKLPPPVVNAPIYDGATSVAVDRIVRGAIVDLLVDGRWRTSVESGGEVVSIALDSSLRAHQTVVARQRLCDRTSESAPVTVRFPPVFITSGRVLPRGTAGSSYAFRFTAGGGLPPYVWSISSALPSGLLLEPNGLLSGTLERFDFGSRDINFSVTVHDSDRPPGSQFGGFTLPVDAAAAPPPSPPPAPVGHSHLVVVNCDPAGHLLHVWIREAVAGSAWRELGTIADMRDDRGFCPVGAPFMHELTDGRVFEYAVVDPAGLTCGANDPDILGCRRVSGTIRGDARGTSFVVSIPP